MKEKKKNTGKGRKYDKQYKVMAILLMFFSILFLLALISYTKFDEENARVGLFDLFGLLTGNPEIEAKSATTQNWLGLIGAWISFLFYQKTVGFAFLPIPMFIFAWSRYLFTGKKVSDTLIRYTSLYLFVSILFAGLMGSLNTLPVLSDIQKEWSGSVGQFLASVSTDLLGSIGSVILYVLLILVSVYLGSDVKLKPLIDAINNSSITFIESFRKKKSNAEEVDNDILEPDEIETANQINDDKEAKSYTVKPESVKIIKRSQPVINIRKNDKSTVENKSDIDENDQSKNQSGIINIESDDFEDNLLKGFKPVFKEFEEEDTFSSTDFTKDQVVEDLVEEQHVEDNTKSEIVDDYVRLNSENNVDFEKVVDSSLEKIKRNINQRKSQGSHIEEKTKTAAFSDKAEENVPKKQLNVVVNKVAEVAKDPVYLIGTSVLDEEINYKFPSSELLISEVSHSFVDDEELKINAQILQEKLETFKIYIENLSVTPGPVVTQYEFVPAAGIKISKIESLSDDLAMALKAKGIRIIAPIPGKGTIGVEIPNANPAVVRFGETILSSKFKTTEAKLPLVMGKTISGDIYIVDLAKMPHLLIAGSTGSGKSVGINTIIASLIYKLHPRELKFVMIDPKKVELQSFNKLKKHYMASSPDIKDTIITKPEDAVSILKSAVAEMELRYDILASVRQKNIADYNVKVKQGAFKDIQDIAHKPMPYIVIIIDELADLMLTASKEIEEPITRLAQMARAVGIHLVIATQRPSVDVITGIIKANFPARIAYLVASKIDSRTILDMQGAEQLLGQGDMLCLPPGSPKPVRIQNSFITTDEVEAVCDFIGAQKGYSEPYYLPSINEKSDNQTLYDPSDRDPLFEEAARLIVRHQQGSVSLIQRRLKVGYARAGRIVDELENAGVIGPFDGSKARLVLIESEADLERIL
ncbi:DNA translocase FtsK [Candidatus Kapaibacterium sp.]